jgi:hypothetical protein
MFAPPYPNRIVTFRTPSNAHLGSALSPMLTTLEDVFLCISVPLTLHGPLLGDLVHWRKFFQELRNVTVLRLHHGLATEVADTLRQPSMNPSPAQEEVDPDATTTTTMTTTTPSGPTMNGSRSIFDLDIFPLLKQIVFYTRTSDSLIPAGEFVSGLESFREYAIARQQVGRPVEVFWNRILDLPWLYTLPDVGA